MLEASLQHLADPDGRDAEATSFGEDAEAFEQLRDRFRGAHRLSGDEQHAALDPIAEKGPSILCEEVVLVAPQLEVGERVGAVLLHEVPRQPAGLGVRKQPRRSKRSEDEVCREGQRRDCAVVSSDKSAPAPFIYARHELILEGAKTSCQITTGIL